MEGTRSDKRPDMLLSRLRERHSRSTLSQSLAADIEDIILRGDLAHGQRLPTEVELVESLNVSRSVVRDAMRILEARRFIEVKQGRGTVVAAPSDAAFADALVALLMRSDLTMGDIIEARAAIEAELAPLAARHGTECDWDGMQKHLDQFASAVEQGLPAEAHAEHLQFHLTMFAAIHLPALELLLRPMQHCMVFSSLPPALDDPDFWEVPSHYPIMDALRAGDEGAAKQAVYRHFEYMKAPAYEKFRAIPFRSATSLEAYRAIRNVDG